MEYLWLDRDDDTFMALVYLPWINGHDQFMFFLTVMFMLPKSRIAIQHLQNPADTPNTDTTYTGFRILVSQDGWEWAIHAIMTAEK